MINTELKQQIENILYNEIISDSDPDIPCDEFRPEAERLLDWLSKTPMDQITDRSIAKELSIVFTDQFGTDYSEHSFEKIAQEIYDLIKIG